MANNLTDTAENLALDALHGLTGTGVVTTPLKCRLMTATGTDASAGTEVTGGSYASQTVTFSAASAGATSNSGALNYTAMPAVTVTAVEVWDSAGTPKRIWSIPLTASKTTNSGDTFTIAAAALSVSLD